MIIFRSAAFAFQQGNVPVLLLKVTTSLHPLAKCINNSAPLTQGLVHKSPVALSTDQNQGLA